MDPLSLLVKASVLLAAAALTAALVGRRVSAAMRHLLWSLTIAGLLAMPLLAVVVPASLPVPIPSFVPITASPAAAAPDAEPIAPAKSLPVASSGTPLTNDRLPAALSLSALLAGLYLAGVAALLGRLVVQRLSLASIVRCAARTEESAWISTLDECRAQIGTNRDVRLLRTLDQTMPMAFGVTRSAILMPAVADLWPADRRRAVLLHELAHVARHDCLTQLVAALACALYWVHPGVWWVARRLRVERELACDDRVLAAGADPHDYAGHLLDVAYTTRGTLAPAISVSMARPRQLEGRLLALLDAARNRSLPTLRTTLLGTTAAIVVIATLAAGTATRAASPPPPQSAGATASQPLRPGTWEVRQVADAGRVHLRMSDGDGYYGSNVDLESLSGLASSLLSGPGGPAGFSVKRDAGTFTFEGIFRNGVGAGTYTFAPNAAFAGDVARRGFDRPTAAQLERMARANVGTSFFDELVHQGYQKSTLPQIMRALDHGITTLYLRDMDRLGYRVGTVEALVELRDHGVSPSFITGLAAEGLPRLTVDDLVKARDHGVHPDYVRQLSQLGLRMDIAPAGRDSHLTLDALVRARDHGVSPEYVRGLRDRGYTLGLEELIRLRDHGVTVAFVGDIQQLGYARPTVDELVGLRTHGIDPEEVRRANARSRTRLSIDTLKSMAARGWR